MIERVCPTCSAGNSREQAYCGQCGSLLSQPLAKRTVSSLARRPISIPARWKQTGKMVALGVASVAAEAGIAWLQRRQQPQIGHHLPRPVPQQTARVIALGRRVSETWVGGQLQHRTEEQVMWLMPEDSRP